MDFRELATPLEHLPLGGGVCCGHAGAASLASARNRPQLPPPRVLRSALLSCRSMHKTMLRLREASVVILSVLLVILSILPFAYGGKLSHPLSRSFFLFFLTTPHPKVRRTTTMTPTKNTVRWSLSKPR
jgi:hypothetical protein